MSALLKELLATDVGLLSLVSLLVLLLIPVVLGLFIWRRLRQQDRENH